MPPNSKNPKVDNNTIVWNAIAKQIDIANEFRNIYNKLDKDRLVEDMGVANRNSAHHRFRRWTAWIAEQSTQLNENVADAASGIDKAEPVANAGKDKMAGLPLKDEIKREGNALEAANKRAGMKRDIGKRKKMEDKDFTDFTNEEKKRARVFRDADEDTSGNEFGEDY